MKFDEHLEPLEKLHDLDKEPIAVSFTIDKIPITKGKIQMCNAIKQAAEGESFVIDEEISLCTEEAVTAD